MLQLLSGLSLLAKAPPTGQVEHQTLLRHASAFLLLLKLWLDFFKLSAKASIKSEELILPPRIVIFTYLFLGLIDCLEKGK